MNRATQHLLRLDEILIPAMEQGGRLLWQKLDKSVSTLDALKEQSESTGTFEWEDRTVNGKLATLAKATIVLAEVIIGLLLLMGCSSSGEVEETASAIVDIFVFPGEPELRLITEEPIAQDNCNGSAETSQTVTREHTVLYTLELGLGIEVSADGRAKIPEIGEVGVGVEVAETYEVGYGREVSVSRAVTVAAREGTHIQHTIRQYEVWETGEILLVAGNINQRLPYSFRRDFSIEQLPAANIGCPGGGGSAAPADESDLPTEVVSESMIGSTSPLGEGPSQESSEVQTPILTHMAFSAGEGVFANVSVSDGQAEYSSSDLSTQHQHIQRIRREEQPSGCDTAIYASSKIWVSGTPGMELTLDGQIVGTYRIAPDSHGYMLDMSIEVGQEICAVDFGPEGFSIIFGPDVYYHYDSYCFRGNC